MFFLQKHYPKIHSHTDSDTHSPLLYSIHKYSYTFTTYDWHKSNTGGFTYLFLFLNGSVNFEFRNTRASSHSEYNRVGFTTTLAMSANDYVHVEGSGSGGGELHTSAGSIYSHFSGYLIG